MNREVRLYNVIFPIWLLCLFPPFWLAIFPANFLVDGLVLFLALKTLGRRDKGPLLKKLLWKMWLLGFLADFAGVLFLGAVAFGLYGIPVAWWQEGVNYVTYNAFGHPLAFLLTAAGVAVAGVCIYRLDGMVLRDNAPELSEGEQKRIALLMAVFTAPYLFFVPVY